MANANDIAILAKYRDTPEFTGMLEIISPTLKRREACEHDLATALWGVEWAAKIKLVRTPVQYRKVLQEKLAPTLRKAIKLAPQAFPFEYLARQGNVGARLVEELKAHLKETEEAIDWINEHLRKAAPGVRKGSPRINPARIVAIDAAYFLLTKYSSKRPTRSRAGDWHTLAIALFGVEDADLFDH
jgi:hypothetical protein